MAQALPEIVGSIDSVSNATPMVVSLTDAHGLKDQDEVKITALPEGNGSPKGSCFVKTTGYDRKQFALYWDKALTQPAAGSGEVQSGGTVYRPFPDDYAIVVGINRYPAFSPLQGPEADAIGFRDWLLSPTGGMMSSDNVTCILSSQYPDPGTDPLIARPAVSDVKSAFNRLRELAFKATNPKYRVGRRVYLFFSGHGITPARAPSPDLDDAAILMANASTSALDEHLPGHPYAEWLRNAGAFDEIVLVMDCCRDLKNNVSSIGPTPPLISDRREEVRRFYAAATELDSKSWEQPLGTPPQPHGVFTFALMEGLRRDAICDSQGRLTGTRLKAFLESCLADLRTDQVPRIYPVPEPAKDIVFVAKRRVFKPNLRILFGETSLNGKEVQLIGKAYSVPEATHVIDGTPWELRVDGGFYKLQVPGGPETKPWELKGTEEMLDVRFP